MDRGAVGQWRSYRPYLRSRSSGDSWGFDVVDAGFERENPEVQVVLVDQRGDAATVQGQRQQAQANGDRDWQPHRQVADEVVCSIAVA
jgi:hypothetical protein